MESSAQSPNGQDGSTAHLMPGGMATGVAKTWQETRGFGFITEDGTSEDIFCHRRDLEGCTALVPGDKVQFQKFQDTIKQKWLAKQVTGGTGVAPSLGIVKSWNDERGFGFITDQENNEDLYTHRTYLADGAQWLTVGQRVKFTHSYDETRQKKQATQVMDSSGKGGAKGASKGGWGADSYGGGYGGKGGGFDKGYGKGGGSWSGGGYGKGGGASWGGADSYGKGGGASWGGDGGWGKGGGAGWGGDSGWGKGTMSNGGGKAPYGKGSDGWGGYSAAPANGGGKGYAPY